MLNNITGQIFAMYRKIQHSIAKLLGTKEAEQNEIVVNGVETDECDFDDSEEVAFDAEEVDESATEVEQILNESVNELTGIHQVGEATAKELVNEGFMSVEDVEKASVDALTEVTGIGPHKAKEILDSFEDE